jgi:hypothetical protein
MQNQPSRYHTLTFLVLKSVSTGLIQLFQSKWYFLQSLHNKLIVYSSTEALMQSFDLHSLYTLQWAKGSWNEVSIQIPMQLGSTEIARLIQRHIFAADMTNCRL